MDEKLPREVGLKNIKRMIDMWVWMKKNNEWQKVPESSPTFILYRNMYYELSGKDQAKLGQIAIRIRDENKA